MIEEKTAKQGDIQEIRNIEKDLSYVCLQGRRSVNVPKSLWAFAKEVIVLKL